MARAPVSPIFWREISSERTVDNLMLKYFIQLAYPYVKMSV